MKNLKIFLFSTFILLLPLSGKTDFKPLKLQIDKFQSLLSESETITKRDLKKNLKLLMNKAKSIESKLASGHINDDLKFLMNKYVYKNSDKTVKTSELIYWIEHLDEELIMFKEDMGIDGWSW